jgi:hypothetical protein
MEEALMPALLRLFAGDFGQIGSVEERANQFIREAKAQHGRYLTAHSSMATTRGPSQFVLTVVCEMPTDHAAAESAPPSLVKGERFDDDDY